MNERIRELKIQASKEVWGTNPYTGAPEFDGLELDVEKFAELIVRECVQSIENTIQTNCETDGEKMGCEFAITDLKKHFGVEE